MLIRWINFHSLYFYSASLRCILFTAYDQSHSHTLEVPCPPHRGIQEILCTTEWYFLAFRGLQVQDPTQLCFLEYCLVITPNAMTMTPIAIIIYPFTVHSGLLYMNEVEGPREDLLWRRNIAPRMIITNPIIINGFVTSTERYLWKALLYIISFKSKIGIVMYD